LRRTLTRPSKFFAFLVTPSKIPEINPKSFSTLSSKAIPPKERVVLFIRDSWHNENIFFIFRHQVAKSRSKDIFSWGDEKSLLLIDINERDFYSFLDDYIVFLNVVVKELEKC